MRALTITRLAAVGAVAAVLLTGCSGSGGATTDAAKDSAPGSALATRKATAGPVGVSVTPTSLDGAGARFKIELDNHQVDLDGDYAATSQLTVGGSTWTSPRWSGDGPTGHHRGGTLSFVANGAPTGPVQLKLGGLPEPVTLTWNVQG